MDVENPISKKNNQDNNISNKKILNNLSNLKNKPINNLVKAPDNLTTKNYYSDNNLNNKDYRQISKKAIDATPTFYRNTKAEQSNKGIIH